jgi:hypothetical protein
MPRRLCLRGVLVLLFLACACWPLARSQQPDAPLRHTFRAGDVQRYRVELTVRTAADGQRPRTVGRQTFAEQFSESSSGSVSWRATRRVLTVQEDGSAEIEEILDEFSQATASGQLKDELQAALREWSEGWPLILRYREAASGQIAGLSASAGPVLDEDPALLTLWLRRALRPSTALPSRPPRVGETWSEGRRIRLPPWNNLMGSEEFAWLEAPVLPSATRLINLHVVQRISSLVSGRPMEGSHWPGRFHSESLSTLVHAGAPLHGGYGALHSATRSGTRETTHVGEKIPTLADLPVFRARTAAEVRIQVME